MQVTEQSTRALRPPYGWVGAVGRSTTARRLVLLALLGLLAGAQLAVGATSAGFPGAMEDFPCGP